MKKQRVLFLCTGNSCRSQMAEGLLKHLADDTYESLSAGARPAGYVHEQAIAVMAESRNRIPTSTARIEMTRRHAMK